MPPTRPLPAVGDRAEIVYLARTEAARIVGTAGTSVTVRTAAGDEMVFELNRLTGHWVRHGEPYWGTRLRILR